MKNKPQQYNWHFWVKGDKFQVVIEKSNYSSAVHHMKRLFPDKKWTFQFGNKI
jgi:hypothetical protein